MHGHYDLNQCINHIVFIIFRGQFNDYHEWWILSPHNLTYAMSTRGNGVSYWGYMACGLKNPVNCKAPWNFYWGVTSVSHADPFFAINDGMCYIVVCKLQNGKIRKNLIEFGVLYVCLLLILSHICLRFV